MSHRRASGLGKRRCESSLQPSNLSDTSPQSAPPNISMTYDEWDMRANWSRPSTEGRIESDRQRCYRATEASSASVAEAASTPMR